jgi:hypothetical protein
MRITKNFADQVDASVSWKEYEPANFGAPFVGQRDLKLEFWAKSGDIENFSVLITYAGAHPPPGGIELDTGPVAVSDDWQRYRYQFLCSADPTSLIINFILGDSGSIAYLDELYLSEVSAYQTSHGYDPADLDGIGWCQSGASLFLLHPDYPIASVEYLGPLARPTEWQVAEPSLTADPFGGAVGWPACCAPFEGRMAYAGATPYPNRIWISRSGDELDLTTGTADDDAIDYTVNLDSMSAIDWLASREALFFGSTAGEGRLGSGNLQDPLTPANVYVRRESTRGTSGRAAMVRDAVFVLDRTARRVYRLRYDARRQGYIATEPGITGQGILDAGVSRICFQRGPEILWCLLKDGTLAGLTYAPEDRVAAWHHHTTDGTILDAATVSAVGRDDLYLLVKRTDTEGDHLLVEVMERPYGGDDYSDAFFVDGRRSFYPGDPVLSGATWFAGVTVDAIADNVYYPDTFIDANGETDFGSTVYQVHLGRPYTATAETMDLEIPTETGPSAGRTKRIRRVTARVEKSAPFELGPDADNLRAMDGGVSAYTGDLAVIMPGGYRPTARIMIEQAESLPLTLRALFVRAEVGD